MASGNRAANLKSHGTLECTSASQDVLLASEDLRYLAGECDKLESVIASLQLTGNPNVEYSYHHHTGVETVNGGCHTVGYHVHSGSNLTNGGCYTSGYHEHTNNCSQIHVHVDTCARTHTHTSACYNMCGYEGGRISGSPDYPGVIGTCNKCGARQIYGVDGFCHQAGSRKCNNLPLNTYACDNLPLNSYTCNNSPNNRWGLTCNNSPTNRWALGCGWREGEIMSAKVTFSPSGN